MKKLYFLILALLALSGKNIAQSTGVTNYTCTIMQSSASSFALRSALAIDNAGNKWIGLNSGTTTSFQLIRYNSITTTWDTFPHIPGRKVNALAVDASNNLWIASNGGLIMFNGSVYTYYNRAGSGILSDTINTIACGGGNVYMGTNHGLSVFNGSTFTNYNQALSGLSHDTIFSITYENSNTIWLGNRGGLEKFNGITFNYYGLGSVGNDKVNCIYIDQTNNKWLGTNTNGVVKFDNINFNTMQQLFNQYTIIGGVWPKQTFSICKGPTGGVSFELASFSNPTLISAGLVEVNGTQTTLYHGVGVVSGHAIFQCDASSNKIFFINTGGTIGTGVILFSFDTALYVGPPFIIQNSNSTFLDINNVGALITANDDMGWDGGNHRYYVPSTTTLSTLFASSLWIGGYHNGGLRVAAMTYRQNGMDFWPGPLDTINDTIDVATENAFNRVWKIDRFDVANFIYNWGAGTVQSGAFVPPADFLSWPGNGTGSYAHNLAPYVDLNGNGIYDPIHDGDYPLIKGDQMIWRVFNDKANKHTETGGAPMGIEVQASAYAFICPNIADSNRVLNYTTFYNYKITNRSQDKIDSCIVANWMDTDLGNYQDDYIGCDVMNNYGFTYNGDNNDSLGYGYNLPVFACNVLSGPPADIGDGRDNNNNGIIDEANEKCMMGTFTYYTNTGDPQTGNPMTNAPIQYYNLINSKWKNGTPMTYGTNGTFATNPACKHLFPGMSDPYGITLGGSIASPVAPPVNDWTQYTAMVVKNDMRFITGSGPFTMNAGGTYEIDYAFVFSQDSANCYGASDTCTLARAKQDNIRVKHWFDTNTFPSCLNLSAVGIQKIEAQQLDLKVYPNPSNDNLYIEFKEAKEKTTVEIFDMLGNVVKGAIFNDASKYISIPIENLTSGVYSIRIKTGNSFVVKKFVKE
jgi:hypothetical protein